MDSGPETGSTQNHVAGGRDSAGEHNQAIAKSRMVRPLIRDTLSPALPAIAPVDTWVVDIGRPAPAPRPTNTDVVSFAVNPSR